MTNLNELKAKIDNYKQAITASGVPEEYMYQPIVLERSEVEALLNSSPGAEGFRIYMSKDTNDPNTDDYRLLLIPCRKVTPQAQGEQVADNQNEAYFEDIVDEKGLMPAYRDLPTCKNPPGCPTTGALLL